MSAFLYPRRGRALLSVLALLFAVVFAGAQTRIRSLTGVINGHQVGGVTIDLIGNIYVADFGDLVWKITPEGKRQVFASGLYGASGNAIDKEGNLLQANYYGDSITRIDRKGQAKPFVTSGLSGPVGIAINRRTGDVYVANCRDNSIAKITTDGAVSSFAKSDLFKCPNGISFDRDGNLYVVNFRDNRMLKVDPKGFVAPFATVSEKGLGHLCFKDDRFYVAAYESHAIYEVTLGGVVKRILGNGMRGVVDGGAKARLSFPNGIACSPWERRLYINESVNDSTSSLPRRTIIREIVLEADK
jgi:DNA-binding beta-propeller fold protein YncE